jgi:ABC-type transport system involved in cytochrome bd biosynthesis fused ATPase/permease subunit
MSGRTPTVILRSISAGGGRVMSANPKWPLERVLFALAGTVTLLSALLAVTISGWFLLLTVFVGVNQWLYVLVGACPASLVLGRAFHLRSAIYDESARSAASTPNVAIR